MAAERTTLDLWNEIFERCKGTVVRVVFTCMNHLTPTNNMVDGPTENVFLYANFGNLANNIYGDLFLQGVQIFEFHRGLRCGAV